jgi:predicted peroxiredoxin
MRAATEDITMTTGTDKLVILLTKGIDSEISSVAFTIANGGLTAGLKVSIFLTSTAIDLVRRGGQKLTQVAPLQPLAGLIEDFQKRGGTLWACPPCVQSRGYQQADLLDGVTIVGASAMHAEIKQGAATLSF